MIDSEASVLVRECFLEMWYLNRDLPEVKMQAIKTPGRSKLQADTASNTKALQWECARRRLLYGGWSGIRNKSGLLGPHYMQGLCTPFSSLRSCSECVGLLLVDFEQIKIFKTSNQLSLHLLCRD